MDIPIAQYYGDEADKTLYRNYLAQRYGRYKMTFSGIHFNYSFSEEMLRLEFAERGGSDWRAFKDQFYVSLAERMEIYGWLLVAVTAASPLLDSSFVAKGILGETLFYRACERALFRAGVLEFLQSGFGLCEP